MSLDRQVERLLRDRLARPDPLGEAGLADLLRLLAKWRHQKIANTIAARDGTVVPAGPFAGLILGRTGSEGAHAPRLLGCYEAALHPHLERLIARGFARVVNVGCADGYYAVGLARRLPLAMVHAHDRDARARELCAQAADANGVAARVLIGGEVDHAALDALLEPGSWLVMDIEGAEMALLDPARVPRLGGATVLVECHEQRGSDHASMLAARFAPTHRVTRVEATVANAALPAWLQRSGHLDQLLALWEWRQDPTPWLILEPA